MGTTILVQLATLLAVMAEIPWWVKNKMATYSYSIETEIYCIASGFEIQYTSTQLMENFIRIVYNRYNILFAAILIRQMDWP